MKPLNSALLGGFATLLSLGAAAEHQERNGYGGNPQARTTVTVTLSNLNCSAAGAPGSFLVSGWTLGANNGGTVSGGGSGAGKVSFTALSVSRNFDACSPALMSAVAQGRHYPSLMLVQQDAGGNVVLTVDLRDVLVTAWNIGASNGQLPLESVSFEYAQVAIADANGNRSCWDVRLNRSC